jgi:hypothetical protein
MKKKQLVLDVQEIKVKVQQLARLKLTRNTRLRRYVYPRAIYFKLCKEFTHSTLVEIGSSVGRDHASVLHGLKVFNVLIMYSESVLQLYTKIKKELLFTSAKDLKRFNDRNYYKIKYEELLDKHYTLLEKIGETVEE